MYTLSFKIHKKTFQFQTRILFVRNPEGDWWFADADHKFGLQIPGAWRGKRRVQGVEEHGAVCPAARLLFNGCVLFTSCSLNTKKLLSTKT